MFCTKCDESQSVNSHLPVLSPLLIRSKYRFYIFSHTISACFHLTERCGKYENDKLIRLHDKISSIKCFKLRFIFFPILEQNAENTDQRVKNIKMCFYFEQIIISNFFKLKTLWPQQPTHKLPLAAHMDPLYPILLLTLLRAGNNSLKNIIQTFSSVELLFHMGYFCFYQIKNCCREVNRKWGRRERRIIRHSTNMLCSNKVSSLFNLSAPRIPPIMQIVLSTW